MESQGGGQWAERPKGHPRKLPLNGQGLAREPVNAKARTGGREQEGSLRPGRVCPGVQARGGSAWQEQRYKGLDPWWRIFSTPWKALAFLLRYLHMTKINTKDHYDPHRLSMSWSCCPETIGAQPCPRSALSELLAPAGTASSSGLLHVAPCDPFFCMTPPPPQPRAGVVHVTWDTHGQRAACSLQTVLREAQAFLGFPCRSSQKPGLPWQGNGFVTPEKLKAGTSYCTPAGMEKGASQATPDPACTGPGYRVVTLRWKTLTA